MYCVALVSNNICYSRVLCLVIAVNCRFIVYMMRKTLKEILKKNRENGEKRTKCRNAKHVELFV